MCYRLYSSHEVSNAARQARARAAKQAKPAAPARPEPVASDADVRVAEPKTLEHA